MFGDNDIDFSRPFESATWIPWIAHRTDAGQVDVELGEEGQLHNDLRQIHDIGDEVARGYVRPDDNESITEAGAPGYDQIALQRYEDSQDAHHYAAVNDQKWVYLNGHVGFGDKHYQIAKQLGEHLNIPDHELNKIVNHALVNVPPGAGNHQVAWGSFHRDYPAIWRTNADRNAVWDTVRNSRDTVQSDEDMTRVASPYSYGDAGGPLHDIENHFLTRRPWFISPETGNPVIGQPGQFHAAIMDQNGYKDANGNEIPRFDIPMGVIFHDGRTRVLGGVDPIAKTFARMEQPLREATGLEPHLENWGQENWEDAWEPPTINFKQIDRMGSVPSKPPESDSRGFVDSLKGLAQRVGFKGLKTPSAIIPSDD